ncbi:hemicentin-1-like [Armigeres subalbatus]|uniref:hemicentin-1-like n=1 Tax=Armigeres subalbatus TaxID=124917 RepID=UPI002ED14450
MRTDWLIPVLSIAHFAIFSAASSNTTDNDELWTLLLNGKLNQIITEQSPEVTPTEAAVTHSEVAINGNINYVESDKDADDSEQLFHAGDLSEALDVGMITEADADNVTMPELFSSDWESSIETIRKTDDNATIDGSGELFDDSEGMQADGTKIDDELIDVLLRKPASREILGLLGLLKERNETEEMKSKVMQVLRPMSERLSIGLPSILEETTTTAATPAEEVVVVDPLEAESLVSDGVQSPTISNILIPNLEKSVPTIRRGYEAPTVGQRSLVIVFDATGSMLDDLKQLREGAKLIIDEITQLKNNPIYNYVFVPFRDPQVGPRLVTRNKNELLQSLENLQIYGGGDCPEAALGAIYDAIEAALPHSFVYVFTDATAKDFKLDQRVLRLVQQKQTPITFLLTGFCDGKDTPGHKVMNDIAAASNGQVYDLKKDQIEHVLLGIKEMMSIDHVPLKSVDSNTSETHDIDLSVDSTLKEFSVSVAGHRPKIEIIDPRHTPYNNTRSVLDLENIKVVNVAEPLPGKWNIKAGSTSSHSVRLSGNSELKFNFGFSGTKPISMDKLSRQPILNSETILTIQPSQPDLVHSLSHVTIASHDPDKSDGASFKFKLPLNKTALNDTTPIFMTPKFQAPRQRFKVSVSGNDVNGNPLDRLISTAIQSSGLSAPDLSLDLTDIDLLEGDDFAINCRAESLVPMLMQWKKFNRVLVEQPFDDTNTLLLRFTNVTTKHSGRYACRAMNSVGEQEILATVRVHVRPEPELGVYPKDIVAYESERLIALRCITKHVDPKAQIVWSHNGKQINHTLGQEYLELHNISTADDGTYECRVESDGRILRDSTQLSVEYAPQAPRTLKDTVSAAYGQPLSLGCGLKGNPNPSISWSYHSLDKSEEQRLTETGTSLTIAKVVPEVEGFYICEGRNRHGTAKRTILVQGEANEAPKITKPTEKVVYVEPGSRVTLNCSCDLCQPLREYIWTSAKLTFESNPYDVQGNARVNLNIDQTRNAVQYQLTIDNFGPADQGSYSCILSNAHGADSFVMQARLMIVPQVDGVLIDDELHGTEFLGLKDSVEQLTCDTSGLPEPSIRWTFNKQSLNHDDRFKLLNDNKTVYLVEHFSESYSGHYECTATNPIGTSTGEVFLRYGSIPEFVTVPTDNILAEAGQPLWLDCQADGVPEPEIKWYFNDQLLEKVQPFNMTLHDSGIYECRATNKYGFTSASSTVIVYGKPELVFLSADDEVISVSRDENITLPCAATGFPEPYISWTFDGEHLDELINFEPIGTGLQIFNISSKNQGSYVCNAENSQGRVQKVYYVVVKESPSITSDIPDHIEILPEQEVHLNCTGTGNPIPRTFWTKNNVNLPETTALKILHSSNASGTYTCTLENEEGSDSRSTEVTVLNPPIKTDNASSVDSSIDGKLNNPLTLVCPFNNYESLLWQLNHRNLDTYFDLSDVRLFQNILQIDKLRQDHEGTYTCFVENQAGRNNHSFIVGILSPPVIYSPDDEISEDIDDLDDSDEDSGIDAEVSLLSGEQLRLICHASGSPRPSISWTKDDNVIINGNELTIDNVDTHHNGVYTCIAENDLGSARKVYRLDVMNSPRHWGEASSHIEVFKDEDLQLECSMEANPPAHFRWTKDDIILDEFEDVLEFIEIQPQDSGVYSCEAENIFGADEKKFHVTVYQPSEITFFPENLTVTSDNTIELNCEAVGSPLPIVSIVHRGEVLATTSDLDYDTLTFEHSYRVKPKSYAVQTQQFIATKLSSTEIQFTIIQPNAAINNAGKYHCLAQNAVGHDEKVSKVEVLVSPYVQLSKLKIGPNLSLLEGLPLYLHCPISGYPKPTITWYRNAKPIKFDGQILFIASTTRTDQGNYTCLSENSVGKQELSFSVSILVPPTMINSVVLGEDEVADQARQEEIHILKGDNVTLDCASLGNPNPEIFWTKVVYLDEKLNEQLSNKEAVLELYDIDATSTYSCYVNNTAGSTEKLFHIVVQSPPRFLNIEYNSKPVVSVHHSLDLNCEVVGAPEAEVVWTKDGVFVDSQLKGIFLASNGQILRISGAQSTDAGEYKCVGRNLHGQISREFFVTIDVPVSWSPWAEWSTCSATCGKGTQFRSRICLLPSGSPAHGKQYNCVGENVQVKNCEMLPCPINGGWGAWSKWSNCSLDCVTEYTGMKSIRFRNRKCDSPPPSLGGKLCVGDEYEEEMCSAKFCAINGEWTPWTNWTPCSETCGFGRTLRWRSCANPAPRNGGLPCQGPESELKICKESECIVDGGWSEWGPWSKCSKSCGAGIRSRERFCTNPEPKNGGKQCKGDVFEVEKCSVKSCRNDALLKNYASKSAYQRKYSPLLTYESKHPEGENEEYDDESSIEEPQKFKVIPNFAFAETAPVEYVDAPVDSDFENELNGHHKITVSLKNTVNLTHDTTVYSLNFGGLSNPVHINCASGFDYDQSLRQCIDVDECEIGDHKCTSVGQFCVNTYGGYECDCSAGYRLYVDVCVDINECRESNHDCSHFCENSQGGYSCYCPAGFVLSSDDRTCTRRRTRDKPEFSVMNYQMICPEGYRLEGGRCVDVDECQLKEDECSDGQACLNTNGSYLCLPTGCPEEYNEDEQLGRCYQDCLYGSNPDVCNDGAHIQQTLTYKVISLKKYSSKQPIAVLSIPAYQHDSTEASFSFLERTYAHVFRLEKTPQSSGAMYLYGNKKFRRGMIYKLKVIAHVFGLESGVMDYAHRFIVFVYCVE